MHLTLANQQNRLAKACLLPVDEVSEEPLRIDRIETQTLAQFLAQLGNVAFNNVLFHILVEDAVDGVEDLLLGDPAAAVGNKIFKDPALAPWKGECAIFDFRVAAIGKDPDGTDFGVGGERLETTADSCRTCKNFAWMNRLANHIINTAVIKCQGGFK